MENMNLQMFAEGEQAAAVTENTATEAESLSEEECASAVSSEEETSDKAEKEKGEDKYSRLLEKLSKRYPEEAKSGEDAVISAFLNENEDEKSLPEAKEEEKSPVKRGDAVGFVRAYLREKAEREVKEYFRSEEEKLREIYPSFSFENELKSSPEFRQLIKSGVSPRRAFETVNLEKIMGQALKYAVMSTGKRTADIMKNSARVSENSLLDTASSVKRTDVNNLTEKEIRKIISEVGKGAKITF